MNNKYKGFKNIQTYIFANRILNSKHIYIYFKSNKFLDNEKTFIKEAKKVCKYKKDVDFKEIFEYINN